jgi:hypothetical protein
MNRAPHVAVRAREYRLLRHTVCLSTKLQVSQEMDNERVGGLRQSRSRLRPVADQAIWAQIREEGTLGVFTPLGCPQVANCHRPGAGTRRPEAVKN